MCDCTKQVFDEDLSFDTANSYSLRHINQLLISCLCGYQCFVVWPKHTIHYLFNQA